jgi:hypothetical protein
VSDLAAAQASPDPPSGSPGPPPRPDGIAVVIGSVLLIACLTVLWGWLFIHVGSVLGSTLATVFTIVVIPVVTLLHSTAADRGRWAFTDALAQSRSHRALSALLTGLLLFAATVSSLQVSASTIDDGAKTRLWVGNGANPSRHDLTPDGPLRKLGLVFTRLPEVRSGDYRLVRGRPLRPFLPRRYQYPDDFEPRLALMVVPDGALFFNFIRREYRIRVLDGSGAVLTDTTLGGRTGVYSLLIDGQISEGAYLDRVHADQPERDSAELAMRAARWSRSRPVRPTRIPRASERLRIEVLHLTREPLLQQSVVLSGPGQIIYLQQELP